MHVIHARRRGDLRLQLIDVKPIGLRIDVAGVGILNRIGTHRAGADKVKDHVVRLDVRRFCTHFHRHVAEHHPLGKAKLLDVGAGEVHRLVDGAVGLHLPEHIKDHVLRQDAGLRMAIDLDLNDLRHTEPELAREHDRRQVGRADARAHRTHRTVGRGV